MQCLDELRKLRSYTTRRPRSTWNYVPDDTEQDAKLPSPNPSPSSSRVDTQRRRVKLPGDVVHEVVQFFTFSECAQWSTVNRSFAQHTEPRLRLKLQMVGSYGPTFPYYEMEALFSSSRK